MQLDLDFLKQFTEIPSVGTACAPAMNLLKRRFGPGYAVTDVSDGFCLFQKRGAGPEALQVVFVAHIDEIGGCVYGLDTPHPPAPITLDRPNQWEAPAPNVEHFPENGEKGSNGPGVETTASQTFASRCWGNHPKMFADAELQAYDYLAEDADGAFPVKGRVVELDSDVRLTVEGDGILPFRTAFTFRTETTFDGDTISGKALDPRVTTFSVVEAVRALDTPAVGAMIVLAEECAMEVARKGVLYLQRNAPNLKLIANSDVPWIENIAEGRLDLPAIRIFEGRNFIDPAFGIRTAERLLGKGVELHLSAARSGSQTILFTPLAPTLSIALPSDGIHEPRYSMSLTGARRCIDLLRAIGEDALG